LGFLTFCFTCVHSSGFFLGFWGLLVLTVQAFELLYPWFWVFLGVVIGALLITRGKFGAGASAQWSARGRRCFRIT